MNIYVGNLHYHLEESQLKDAFSQYGQVGDVKIIIDKFTGRSKGFGFVEMPNDGEGQAAIDALDGTELQGRTMKVNEARPPKPREERGPRNDY